MKTIRVAAIAAVMAAVSVGVCWAGSGVVSGSGNGSSAAAACNAARSDARGEAQTDAMMNYGTARYRITGYGECEWSEEGDGYYTANITASYQTLD